MPTILSERALAPPCAFIVTKSELLSCLPDTPADKLSFGWRLLGPDRPEPPVNAARQEGI
jgi:hypothetical protein